MRPSFASTNLFQAGFRVSVPLIEVMRKCLEQEITAITKGVQNSANEPANRDGFPWARADHSTVNCQTVRNSGP